jgi:hypothetical protein
MSGTALVQPNGSLPQANSWKQQSVQQFLGGFNWEDYPPEIRELKAVAAESGDRPLSLALTVSQFFGSIDWDGNADLFFGHFTDSSLAADADSLTLDDFAALF